MPPASRAVEFAQGAERDGFDAVWWPCHLMGWLPDSVWTPEFTPLAEGHPMPMQTVVVQSQGGKKVPIYPESVAAAAGWFEFFGSRGS